MNIIVQTIVTCLSVTLVCKGPNGSTSSMDSYLYTSSSAVPLRVGDCCKCQEMSRSGSKAKVAIIYSDNDRGSLESRNLAFYLSGLLVKGGWAHCVMIPFDPEGPHQSISASKITLIPMKLVKPMEVPAADVTFSHMSALSEVHMVVVTVNSEDTLNCAKQIVQGLGNRKKIPIFSLQRGIKQSTILSDEAELSGFVVLEAAIGFAAVLDPRNSALVSTISTPGIVFQRLSKEETEIADGPLRLLETMSVITYFRKNITPHVWGMFIFEHLYTLNILTKGSIRDTLYNRKYRLWYALMIRETSIALTAAARGGGWKPDLLLISEILSVKILEMMLLLPNFLFIPIAWLVGILPAAKIISPGQLDLIEGRRTTASKTLSELVSTGDKYKKPCKLCEVVLHIIETVEAPMERGHFASTYLSDNLIAQLDEKVPSLYPNHDSWDEFMYYFTRGMVGLMMLLVLLFLFYHD